MSVFRTTDPEHPGVKMVMEQGEVNLAGPVKVLSAGRLPGEIRRALHDARRRRARHSRRTAGRRVAAFQTRNPMHRSHEYLAKVAIEVCDGVLIHSLLGNLKPGDIPAEVRTRAIAVLIEQVFRARTPWCSPAIRSTCATPGRARRCCTPCSARTTAART